MRTSELYLYTVSILWTIWFLYITGLFVWLATTRFRMTTYLAARQEQRWERFANRKRAVNPVVLCTPTKKLPGVWDDEDFRKSRSDVPELEIDLVILEMLLQIWSPSRKLPGKWGIGDVGADEQELEGDTLVEDEFVLIQ